MNNTKLAEVREDNELSQRELASKLKVSKSTYARWKTEEQIIPLSRLNDFCNYFQISMDYIMGISMIKSKTNNIKELNKKIIGSNLKQIREEQKITQQELADFLNTTHSTISAYENGKTLILTVFAVEICKKYNSSLDWLCGKNK